MTVNTSPCCPNCGTAILSPKAASDPTAALLAAQKQIADLQAQVRLLNQKATAAVDRWADYEDELSRLRAASTSTASTTTAPSHYKTHTPTPSQGGTASNPASSPRASFLNAGANRISQLLSPRKSTPNLSSASRTSISAPALPIPMSPMGGGLSSPVPSTDDLMEALSREQSLRLAAEGKLDETSKEVEELSATLFEQANEMVATERKARAKLEERVGVLEKRDVEKRGRLERLEGAIGRIERVSRLLEEDTEDEEDTDEDEEEEDEDEGDEDEDEEEGEEKGD
ncbi:ribosomal protein L32 [Seiridium cupressi]